jgi:hypothetical protein
VRAPIPTLVLAVFASSCGGGPDVDLARALEVQDVQSGWFDAGISGGQNKLVPSLSFKLRNVSDRPLVTLQVNAVFRRVNETDELGSRFQSVTRSDALGPGETTDVVTLLSPFGYTGTEPRADMLKNSRFVDAKVELAAKYGATQWTRIGDFPVERRLITQ